MHTHCAHRANTPTGCPRQSHDIVPKVPPVLRHPKKPLATSCGVCHFELQYVAEPGLASLAGITAGLGRGRHQVLPRHGEGKAWAAVGAEPDLGASFQVECVGDPGKVDSTELVLLDRDSWGPFGWVDRDDVFA